MKVIFIIAISLVSINSTNLEAAPYCGELVNVRDYTSGEEKTFLGTVEQHHFTSNVESLRHGNTGTLGGELSYTLMIFPNHHRALAAYGKLTLRDKTLKPVGAKYSVGCFFDRAIRFKPNDAMVRMVYGNYLLKAGQIDKATEQLDFSLFCLVHANKIYEYTISRIRNKRKKWLYFLKIFFTVI